MVGRGALCRAGWVSGYSDGLKGREGEVMEEEDRAAALKGLTTDLDDLRLAVDGMVRAFLESLDEQVGVEGWGVVQEDLFTGYYAAGCKPKG